MEQAANRLAPSLPPLAEVYGDPEVHPQPEDYWGNVNPIGPRACYDEGKRVAEVRARLMPSCPATGTAVNLFLLQTLTYGFMRQDNVEVRVARIFNTFGPRMNPYDGRVVSNFIIQALKGEDMTVCVLSFAKFEPLAQTPHSGFECLD